MTTIKKVKKVLLSVIIFLAVIAVGGLIFLKAATHKPTSEALAYEKNYAKVTSETLFFPAQSRKEENLPTILFYPGAMVDSASYSIWAEQVANAGYPVYLLKVPFNMALFAPDAAQKIIDENKIESFVVGGHSLGGVIASRFAHNTTSNHLKGLFLLASYPDEKGRLDKRNLPVLSVTGTRDGILNWDAYASSQKYLPLQTNFQVITGGNHAGFGSYNGQKGDSAANITNEEQQEEISKAIVDWLNQRQYYLNQLKQ